MVGITETVLRDGHQSLIATRMRTRYMLPAAERLDAIGYRSLEVWGGATFDVCLRFLHEDPWDRLRALKRAMPRTPLQMLLRGQNLVGYRHYADDLVRKFVEEAARQGVDIFRVFDALNDARNMEVAIAAVKKAGARAQGTICYTSSPVHTLESFVELGTSARGDGRGRAVHQGHGRLPSAGRSERSRSGAEEGGRATGRRPHALRRRPLDPDVPGCGGRRGRGGRQRPQSVRGRGEPAPDRDARQRDAGHSARPEARPGRPGRARRVLPRGARPLPCAPRHPLAPDRPAHPDAPGPRRDAVEPPFPAQGTGCDGPPLGGAGRGPPRSGGPGVPPARHADQPDRRDPGRLQRPHRRALPPDHEGGPRLRPRPLR